MRNRSRITIAVLLVALGVAATAYGLTSYKRGHHGFDRLTVKTYHLGSAPAAIDTTIGAHLVAYVDANVTAAELLALNATAIEMVAAPGAGKALVFMGAGIEYDFVATACTGVAAGEDLVFKYTNASGEQVSAHVETTGMIDQGNDELRWVAPVSADAAVSDVTPLSNAALVLNLLVGEVADCGSPLDVRIYYRVIPVDLP